MSKKTVSAYNKRAASYEKKWKKYLCHTHQEFLSRIETEPNDTILDISGGTGLLAKKFIWQDRPFQHLVINDPSEKMLAIARSRLSGQPEEKVSYSHYRAAELSYRPNSFNRIFCLNSFHFYPNQPKVLERLHTMLKPGGHLYILDWNRMGLFTIVHQCIKWITSDHIDARSLPEMKTILHKNGFKTRYAATWYWQYWNLFFIRARKKAPNN